LVGCQLGAPVPVSPWYHTMHAHNSAQRGTDGRTGPRLACICVEKRRHRLDRPGSNKAPFTPSKAPSGVVNRKRAKFVWWRSTSVRPCPRARVCVEARTFGRGRGLCLCSRRQGRLHAVRPRLASCNNAVIIGLRRPAGEIPNERSYVRPSPVT